MAQETAELVRLAKLDATQSADLQYTRHPYNVAGTGHRAVRKEAVWKRTIKPLGVGGQGEVYREECVDGESVGALRAVKSIPKSIAESAREINYGRELQTVARFSQPRYEQHFVKSFGWYETENTILIAMQYAQLGDFHQYLKSPFPEQEAQIVTSQVLQGLAFVHSAGYAHRDLKPANLLVLIAGPQWHVKIADFGLSKRVIGDPSSLRTHAGTLGFMSPEMLGLSSGEDDSSGEDQQSSYSNAVDIWAVGVIAHLMLTAEMLFSPTEPRALGRYARGKTNLPTGALIVKGTSSEGQAFVNSLMASRPCDRPTAEASQQHRWLTTHSRPQSEPPLSTSSVASARWTTIDSGCVEQRDSTMRDPYQRSMPRTYLGNRKRQRFV